MYTIDLHAVTNVDTKLKKEFKIEVQQMQLTPKDLPFAKDTAKEIKRLGIKSQAVVEIGHSTKFSQRVVLKARNLEQYEKWEQVLKTHNKDYPKFI